MVNVVIEKNDAGQRLDRFMKKYLKRAPLSMIYKLIRKDIKVNGRRGKEDTILSEGDELSIYISSEKLAELSAPAKKQKTHSRRQFRIAYEDSNILVAVKPRGLLTHGDSHEKKKTLVNQVCGYLQDKGEFDPSREKTFSPAPVNRLDRNTTGLVIFGKNAESLRVLTAAIRSNRHISKYYLTIVSGCFENQMTIDSDLVKDTRSNTVSLASGTEGKSALTIVRPYEPGRDFSIVEIELVTGRTHQIRVHLSEHGFPLIGDPKYGDPDVNRRVERSFGLTTQLLHAYRLEFSDMPGILSYLDGKTVKADLPPDFRRIQSALFHQSGTKKIQSVRRKL